MTENLSFSPRKPRPFKGWGKRLPGLSQLYTCFSRHDRSVEGFEADEQVSPSHSGLGRSLLAGTSTVVEVAKEAAGLQSVRSVTVVFLLGATRVPWRTAFRDRRPRL
jgi:hypothetical protein